MTQSTAPPIEQIREFVLAGHGNLARVKEMLAEAPALLNAAYQWREDDYETALQAAAHVGNRAIAEYLLAQGAPLDICTAAMLGRQAEVERLVAGNSAQIDAAGAHGIALLTHAALSGDLALVQWLFAHGARAGASAALFNAVNLENAELAGWLLRNGDPDLGWKNYEGKTALMVATERGLEPIAQLLREHGAAEA
jgi:ankyrin repeat protein